MTRRVAIVGCGGFGREVHAILQAVHMAGDEIEFVGFFDDHPDELNLERVAALDARVAGTVADLARLPEDVEAVIGIGSGTARETLAARLAGRRFATLVHPEATLGTAIRVGAGVVIAPGSRLSTNIDVGDHVHIDQGCTVGHDTVLGEFSRLNPSACVSGSVRIGAGALIGANATVLQGLTVGSRAVVGAGAVVVRDVPADATVKGVPAA